MASNPVTFLVCVYSCVHCRKSKAFKLLTHYYQNTVFTYTALYFQYLAEVSSQTKFFLSSEWAQWQEGSGSLSILTPRELGQNWGNIHLLVSCVGMFFLLARSINISMNCCLYCHESLGIKSWQGCTLPSHPMTAGKDSSLHSHVFKLNNHKTQKILARFFLY